jgi:hypothetical protein
VKRIPTATEYGTAPAARGMPFANVWQKHRKFAKPWQNETVKIIRLKSERNRHETM